ncbi:MAG: hypothetical protein HW408_1690 [Actinobacteria bacterium]|nr:hypothetical protein [Actinomycetota bacterium]
MVMKRFLPILIAVAGLCVPASSALSAEAAVDLKNDAAVAVSVPLGTDNGVTRDSDFQVAADNGTVLIYPLEIFDNRFWSQPLSDEAYARIRTGMEVRPAALDKAAHAKVRAEGKARKTEIRARQEEARREEETKKIEELKDNRERLLDKRDALEDRIAAAERDLADEEGRMSWLFDSEDSSIERSLQNIQDMAGRRPDIRGNQAIERPDQLRAGRHPHRPGQEATGPLRLPGLQAGVEEACRGTERAAKRDQVDRPEDPGALRKKVAPGPTSPCRRTSWRWSNRRSPR